MLSQGFSMGQNQHIAQTQYNDSEFWRDGAVMKENAEELGFLNKYDSYGQRLWLKDGKEVPEINGTPPEGAQKLFAQGVDTVISNIVKDLLSYKKGSVMNRFRILNDLKGNKKYILNKFMYQIGDDKISEMIKEKEKKNVVELCAKINRYIKDIEQEKTIENYFPK